MDLEKFEKYNFPDDILEPDIALSQYKAGVKEVTWDYEEYKDFVMPELYTQYARSDLQEVLDVDPSIFTVEELEEIYEADKTLLENIDNALKWLYKSYEIRTEKPPKSHWWWYLDLIKYGEMPKPDIDKIFEEYFKKAKH